MATIQTVQPGPASPGRSIINSNFTAINAELVLKETASGAQAKADAAQAAAISAAAIDAAAKADAARAAAISAAEADATSRADAAKAYAVQRANHTGTQAPSTISTDANNRFCTDAEKAVWNGKQAALPNASTIAKITESGGAPLWNGGAWPGGGGGGGTVTTVSIVTANGISGSVASPTLTPAITLTLGAITPASVAATGNVTGANLSGTNTGDQTNVPGNAGTATKLQTARTINGVAFDGTANITVPAVDQTARDAAGTAQTAATSALARANHTGTQAPSTIVQDANNRFVTDAEKAAWDAKETTAGAQSKADAAQAASVQRSNHTGTQSANTIVEDATHRFCTDAEKAAWNAGGGGGGSGGGDVKVGAPTAWWNTGISVLRRFNAGSAINATPTQATGPVSSVAVTQSGTITSTFTGLAQSGFAGVATLATTAASQSPAYGYSTQTSAVTGLCLQDDTGHRIFYASCFEVPILSDATDTFEIHFGFDNEWNRELTLQALMRYKHAENSGMFTVSVVGSTGSESAGTSVAIAANTRVALGVEWDGRPGQNKIRFYNLTSGGQVLLFETVAVSWAGWTCGAITRFRRIAGTASRTLLPRWHYLAVEVTNLAP